jgi:hypothetical protein
MHTCNFVIALIVLILIMIVTNTVLHVQHTGKYMQGLWAADEKFCNDSEIDGMFLYMGAGNGTHDAYIIMHSDNAVIVEKKIRIHMNSYMPHIIHNSVLHRNVYLTDLDVLPKDDDNSEIMDEGDSEPRDMHLSKIMPLKMQMILDTTDGSMTWSHDDTVYAKFYKDNAASAAGSQ